MKTLSLILMMLSLPAIATLPLRKDTAVTVMVGPMVDFADGKTVLANNTEFDPNDIVCRLIKGSTESTLSLTKTGGDHNFNLTGYGMATLTLTAADTNTAGRFAVAFCDATVEGYATETILPFCEAFMVYPANVYDSLFADDTALSKFDPAGQTVTLADPNVCKADLTSLVQDVNEISVKMDAIPTKPSRPSIGQ